MFTCSWCWLKTGNSFSSQTPLTKLHITCEGTIEDDGYGMLQVRESMQGMHKLERLEPIESLPKRAVWVCLAPILFPFTEPPRSRVFHPECLLLLKRPLREHLMCRREFALGLGSRPLSLLCSLRRRYFLYTVRMACSGFHLLFASSCHKLTVDVHTWPPPGHTATWIDGCSVGVGAVVRCWQPVKADFGGWLAVPEMSDQFREICSQTAAHPFAASSWGCEGFGLVCLQANEQLSEMKL